jgi:hypothetical protein
MSLISAGSISLDSTFKAGFSHQEKQKITVPILPYFFLCVPAAQEVRSNLAVASFCKPLVLSWINIWCLAARTGERRDNLRLDSQKSPGELLIL